MCVCLCDSHWFITASLKQRLNEFSASCVQSAPWWTPSRPHVICACCFSGEVMCELSVRRVKTHSGGLFSFICTTHTLTHSSPSSSHQKGGRRSAPLWRPHTQPWLSMLVRTLTDIMHSLNLNLKTSVNPQTHTQRNENSLILNRFWWNLVCCKHCEMLERDTGYLLEEWLLLPHTRNFLWCFWCKLKYGENIFTININWEILFKKYQI